MRNNPEHPSYAEHVVARRQSFRSVTAIALAVTLGLSSAAIIARPDIASAQDTASVTRQAGVTAAGEQRVAGDSVDYIADKFPQVGANSVFDVVTYERLVKSVLRKDGKSIIVLGSPRNASTKAALPEINKIAKSKGIKKIYFFDPHLGGDEGKDGSDIVWDLKNADTRKTLGTWALWGNGGDAKAKAGLKDFDATNKTAQLKYADDDYASDDTLLLVFDRNGGKDSADTIAAQDLLKDRDADAAEKNTADYDARVAKVFDNAGVSGGKETRYGQYDFFSDAFAAATPKVDAAYGADYYRDNPDKFKLHSVTAAELIDILKTPGTHNVLVSGSWCIDSKHAIGYVSENATRFDSGPVYVFDFRTDGRVLGLTDSYFSSDTAGQKPSAGWLGNEILTLLGKNLESGTANGSSSAFPEGDSSQKPVAGPRRVRSPFLAQVKTDKAGQPGEVTKNWIHVLKNYELPWNPYVYDEQYGIGKQAKEGDLLDYELASGNFTEAQRALGRAQIGEFFSGSSVQSTGNPNPPQAYVNSADNGCGDVNDALDNVPGDKLLQYQGTDVYDAKHYAISIDYDPSAADQKSNVTGTTTISATANTDLKAIPLDFREQKLDKGNIAVTSGGSAVTVTNVSGIHDYNTDYNKISLRLGSTIKKGTDFTVTIPYSTGILDAYIADGQASQGFFSTTDGQGIAVLGEPLGSTYWFPSNNMPSDGATYDVSLTAPSEYTAVSAGVRQSVTTNEADGTSTTAWKVTKDTAAYQEFAYISKNVQTLGGNRDDAGSDAKHPDAQQVTISDGKGGTKVIPALSFVNKTTYDKNENRNRDKADTYFNKLPYYIGELEKIAGAYPGESAGFVFDDLSDGTGASASGIGLEGKDRPVLAGKDFTGEQTLIHEYVHQWFGDTARPAAWEDLWLNEAFATYITDQYYENTSGLDVQAKWKKLYDTTDASNEWWQYPVTGDKDEADLFGGASAAYHRGALALAALRATVGDEKFRDIERTWVQEHQGQSVTTAEFVKFASDKSGIDLNDWSKTWLYGTAKPAAWPSVSNGAGDGSQGGEGEGDGSNNGGGNGSDNGNGDSGDGGNAGNTGDGSDGSGNAGSDSDDAGDKASNGGAGDVRDRDVRDRDVRPSVDAGEANGRKALASTGALAAPIALASAALLLGGAEIIRRAGRARRQG